MKFSIFNALLIMAIVVGAFVRVWNITSIPFPPNGDELAFGYYGWSLLHFQTDEYGTFLPLSFPSIGDYKYPGLAYLNIIPAAIFGLSDITTRFWSVISGVVLIALIYLLVLILFKKKVMALASAWIVAFLPWDITVSRLGYENHPALTLTAAGMVCLLLTIKHKEKARWLFMFSFGLLTISTFFYAAERIFVPLMVFIILILSLKKNSALSNLKKPTFLFFLVLFLIVFVSLIPWQNRGRAEKEVWKGLDAKQRNRLEELFIEAGTSPIRIPPIITHIFHNPVRISIEDFLYRYSNHFSPKFLFFEGEAATEKTPDAGVLPIILIFFLPFGLLTILNYKNRHSSLIILAWLLFAPIPSALTVGEPHINRASLMIPAIAVISAYGFWQFLNIFSKKIIILSIIAFLFLLNSFYGLNQIFIHKPVSKPWVSEQINKTMVYEVLKLKENYKAVVIPKDEYIFFLFYGKVSPQKFLNSSSIKPADREGSWDRVERIENIYFNMPYDCPKGGKLNALYICKGPNIPQNSKVLKVIRFLDNVPGYSFVEFYPISKMPSNLPKLPDGLSYMVDIEKDPKSPDGIIPNGDLRWW